MALIQVRTGNLTQLALAFEVAVKRGLVYQRLKRFFRHHIFETDVVAELVMNWLDVGERWVLRLDRANWQFRCEPINLLALSVVYHWGSFPLM